MKFKELAKRLHGLQTVSSMCAMLEVDRSTAINYISMLRKKGYVRTSRGAGKIRLYEISLIPFVTRGEIGLYDYINLHSRIKISKPYEHVIYDNKLTAEEAIIRAIGMRDFRIILASLYLFRLVSDWSRLYRFAKKSGLQREAGALYDLARKHIRVRRMDKRIRNKLLEARYPHRFIIRNMRSRDFRNIEKTWRVYVPFNKGDMRRLKE